MTSPSTFVIVGSSRRNGATMALARAMFAGAADAEIVFLGDHLIHPYSYDHVHAGDDFLPLARRMAAADTIVFATPVYWYTMSAQMKTFFDRLTDLTEIEKPLGRALAGKRAFLISTTGPSGLPESFALPFRETAGYFDMEWGGHYHGNAEDRTGLSEFAKRLLTL